MQGDLAAEHQAAIEALGKMTIVGICGAQAIRCMWPGYDPIDRGDRLRCAVRAVGCGMALMMTRSGSIGGSQRERQSQGCGGDQHAADKNHQTLQLS